MIANIDGAVKSLAQRRAYDCNIIIWHLARQKWLHRNTFQVLDRTMTTKEIMV